MFTHEELGSLGCHDEPEFGEVTETKRGTTTQPASLTTLVGKAEGLYRKRTGTIKAARWNGQQGSHPAVKSGTELAERFQEYKGTCGILQQGSSNWVVMPGDWIVETLPGQYSVMNDALFKEIYEES